MIVDEQLHVLDELAGISELRERVEAMDGVRVFDHPDQLALGTQRLHVPGVPVLEQVEAAAHHHRRRERVRQLNALPADARRRVVSSGSLRQELPPVVIRSSHRQYAAGLVEGQLGLGALLPAEEGLYEDGAGQAEAQGRWWW